MPVHEHYEELCALAASGDLRQDEWPDMEEHLRSCAECRKALAEYTDLYLSMVVEAEEHFPTPLPAGMKQRFVARARGVDVPFNHLPKSILALVGYLQIHRIALVAVAGTVIVIALTSFFIGIQVAGKRDRSLHHATPALPPQTLSSAGNAKSVKDESDQIKSELLRTTEQLRKTQEQLRGSSAALEEKQRALAATDIQVKSLDSQITALRSLNSTLQSDATNREAEITRVQAELEQAREKQNNATTAVLADEQDITQLRRQLQAAQTLNSTLREAHDLIVDPRVKVFNVFPRIDETSRAQQASGKIFYIEGEKLVFYAYDLADPSKISAKASFYLWGQAPAVQRLVGLGKFEVANNDKGHWILKVDDPRLLTGLSSVFVTLEPDKGVVTKPTGKRMLTALLQSKQE